MRAFLFAAVVALFQTAPTLADPRISILAAEGFYGEVARAIGGERVSVESVIAAPGIDPHDFEPPPSVAIAAAEARLVILNGAGYDQWMERLIEANADPDRVVIDVAGLIGVPDGANPHVWYDPTTMRAMANALTMTLVALDPAGGVQYQQNRDAFLATLVPLDEKIASVRQRYAGAPVAATEPVFGYMAEALGLDMQNEPFQTAIMKESEPPASAIVAMEDAIRTRAVKVLFYNSQVEDAFTRNFAELARSAGVPVVAVTETQPDGRTYVEWMLDAVNATAKALGEPSS